MCTVAASTMFKKLFGKPKSSATDVKPHGKTDAMSTIERLNEVSATAKKSASVCGERESPFQTVPRRAVSPFQLSPGPKS